MSSARSGISGQIGPADAIAASRAGVVATLILPADVSWTDRDQAQATSSSVSSAPIVDRDSVREAADALRDLLCAATRERMQANEVNTVWMSGGWDSTSVFAAAQESVRRAGQATQVRPVGPRGSGLLPVSDNCGLHGRWMLRSS